MSSKHIAGTLGLFLVLGISAQVHAGKTVEIVCGDGKTAQIDKMKNTPIAQARLCKKAGHPAPAHKPTLPKPGPQTLKNPAGGESKAALLLPAVIAAREAPAPAKPGVMRPHGMKGFGQRGGNSAADTSCSGVASCNEMIATCIALGGNVTPTSYDPDTGAPSSAICFSPGQQ